MNAQPAELKTKKSMGTLARGLLSLVLVLVMLLVGFVGMGAYLATYQETEFYKGSVIVKAKVLDIKDEQVPNVQAEAQAQGGENTIQPPQGALRKMVTVGFMLKDGQPRKSERLDGFETELSKDDVIEIYYDPYKPADVRFKHDYQNLLFLRQVWKACLVLFLLLAGGLWFINFYKRA